MRRASRYIATCPELRVGGLELENLARFELPKKELQNPQCLSYILSENLDALRFGVDA